MLIDVEDAGKDLSRLVDLLQAGSAAEIIITRHGRPAAKLTGVASTHAARRILGLHNGRYRSMTLEDLNASDTEVAALFSGEESC